MSAVAKIFGGGSQAAPTVVTPTVVTPTYTPPVAPPAYTTPTSVSGAGNADNTGAKAAGAFNDTIITGPKGLAAGSENTSGKKLLGD